MSGSHMKVGNGGPHPSSFGGPKGGSGPKPKVKGASGQKTPPGWANKGDGWMPPGQAKKYGFGGDGFDQKSGGGGLIGNIVGGLFGQNGLFANMFGGWGGNNNAQGSNSQGNSYLGNFAGSTPQAVTSKKTAPAEAMLTAARQGVPVAADKQLTGISQMNPTGADAKYTNAAMNCGPTVLAMIGDAYGLKPQTNPPTSDAAYINQLGAMAGTTGAGTTGNGMIAALNDMGFQTAANKGGDLNWINDQLAQGHQVIANGDYYSIADHANGTTAAGHYVAVMGYNGTDYKVADPATGNVISMSPTQLANFIAAHPEGGFTLAAWPEATQQPAAAPVG